MPSRVSPTEQIRASIDAMFADPDIDLGATMEDVAQMSVRLVFQAALEVEVTEFLGRDRYARGERAREGSRNGYSDVTVKTTAGPVTLKRPKVRGTLEAFSSRLLGKGVTRTNALEALVISGWVRGLSTRDIEAALAETLGPDGCRVEVDGVPDLRRDPHPVRRVQGTRPVPARPGLPVRRRLPLPLPPRCGRRAGPGRLRPSPPKATRSCSPWTARRPSPTTRARRSCATSSPAGCARRC